MNKTTTPATPTTFYLVGFIDEEDGSTYYYRSDVSAFVSSGYATEADTFQPGTYETLLDAENAAGDLEDGEGADAGAPEGVRFVTFTVTITANL